MRSLKIAIAGGWLGGLFAAALLHAAGHEVTVFERSKHGLEGRGAGLVGQREIFAILRAVGCEHVARIGIACSTNRKNRVLRVRDLCGPRGRDRKSVV